MTLVVKICSSSNFMQHISTWVETLLSTKLWSHAEFSSERESGPPGWRKRVAARLPRRRHRFKKDKAISSIARVNLNGGSIKSIDSGAKGIQGNPKGFKVVHFSFGLQLLILAQNNGIFSLHLSTTVLIQSKGSIIKLTERYFVGAGSL